MALCNMGHEHPDADPVEVVTEDKSAEDVAETVSDAATEQTRIEAERDVAVAKLAAKAADQERETELARLQARVDVLEAALAPPAPEPEPEPVIVEPEPEPEPGPPAPEEHEPKPEHSESAPSGGWWSGYR